MMEGGFDSDPDMEPLAMRRREASDDDDDEQPPIHEEHMKISEKTMDSVKGSESPEDSDGQGGVDEYEEEDVYYEDGEEAYGVENRCRVEEEEEEEGVGFHELERESCDVVERIVQNEEEEEVTVVATEPFAVPTAGAFYMHDDRFRQNFGGRHRKTLGGKKLWESKDARKWGHDKFEEYSFVEKRNKEGRRTTRGQYHSRGKLGGRDNGFTRGSRNRMKGFSNNIEQDQAPKNIKGKGPRIYNPHLEICNETSYTRKKTYKTEGLRLGSPVKSSSTSNVESCIVPARKQVSTSSLSSASPPFYPSGSSNNKDTTLTQNADVQDHITNIPYQVHSSANHGLPFSPSSSTLRGKGLVDTVSLDTLCIDEPFSPVGGKSSRSAHLVPSMTVPSNKAFQSSNKNSEIRGITYSPVLNFEQLSTHNGITRDMQEPVHDAHSRSVQNEYQGSLQNRSLSSSPPQVSGSMNSVGHAGMGSQYESSKQKAEVVTRGKVNSQGSSRAPFIHGGTHLARTGANMDVVHSDQNFPATPAFLQVMHLRGQHPRGIGVPAVGMAFPGYVAQPQLGVGNPEMTWLPVLAGANSIRATYCSPYIAIDGSCQPHLIDKASSSTSRENDTNKPNGSWRSSQKPDHANCELGQQQNKTRRYSEMNFGQ